MKVLIACEESQTVCKAFRAKGHEAYSCDILPCSGGHPEWHIQDDVYNHLNSGWDMMIAFPPCTYICFAGIRWNTNNPIREQKTVEAVNFVKRLLQADIEKIALENPVGVIPRRTGIKWTQMIHPWQFGHNEEKKTCLWLKNLSPLVPTDIRDDRFQNIFRRSALNGPGSSKLRSFYRSKTFPGIAQAMADQWGDFISG